MSGHKKRKNKNKAKLKNSRSVPAAPAVEQEHETGWNEFYDDIKSSYFNEEEPEVQEDVPFDNSAAAENFELELSGPELSVSIDIDDELFDASPVYGGAEYVEDIVDEDTTEEYDETAEEYYEEPDYAAVEEPVYADAPAEDNIDFRNPDWKAELYSSVGVGYADEEDEEDEDPFGTPAAIIEALQPSAVPEKSEEEKAAEKDATDYFYRAAAEEAAARGEIKTSSKFLSFVEDTEDIEASPVVYEDLPSFRLEDILAELMTAGIAEDEQSLPAEEEPEIIEEPVISDDPLPAAEFVPEEQADSENDEFVRPYRKRSAHSQEPVEIPAFDFSRDFDSLKAELADIAPDSDAFDAPAAAASSSSRDDTAVFSIGEDDAVSAAGNAADAADASLLSIFAGLDNLGPAEDINIDDRYNITGDTGNTMRFGGNDVDTSFDPAYTHRRQAESYISGYAEGMEPKDEELTPRSSFLGGFLGKKDLGKLAEIRAAITGKPAKSSSEEDFSSVPGLHEYQSTADEESPSETAYAFSELDELPPYEFSYTPDQNAFDSAMSGSSEPEEYEPLPDEMSLEEILASAERGFTPAEAPSAESAEAAELGPEAEPEEVEESADDAVLPGFMNSTPAEGYYHDTDYDYSDPDGDDFESAEEKIDYFPSSFKEYIASGITAFLYRMRPGERGGSATMEAKKEDLGPEVSAVNASKYYGSFSNSLLGRLRICAVIMLIMTYVSIGWPATGMLKTMTGASEFCLILQLTIMLLSLDVVTTGIMDLVRRKPGAASLAVLSCALTSLDVLISAIGHHGTLHMPLCVFSSLSLTGLLFASLLHARGMRKSLRVPAISRRAYSVTGEMGVRPREITLLKSIRPSIGFVRRSEEASPDEEFFLKASPVIIILAVLLGMITAAAKRSAADLIYYIAAILSLSVPFTSLIAFSLPFYLGSVSIFSSGAAIAGWSGLSDIGRSKNIVITDRDLFPDGSVELKGIRIFADAPEEKVIAFAGTMAAASGSCLAAPFAELMMRNGCRMRMVSNFEFLAGGGLKGIIDGEVVVFGNSDMLRLLNIRVPFSLVNKKTVLLAIDGKLYGIFNAEYTPSSSVREALIQLMQSGRHPIFAIRDFNITPEMLHDCFDIATDGYDFPPYLERYKISAAEPSEDSKIAAVVCREGLAPLTRMTDVAYSMYSAVVANTIVTAAAAVIGMFAMFIALLAAEVISIRAFVLFMVIAALPVFFVSVFMKN